MHVRPIMQAFAVDVDRERASRFADELGAELGIEVSPNEPLAAAMQASDICVTCTPAHQPILQLENIRPGLFIAAVGADSPDKQELEPAVLGQSKVVVDVVEQAASIGELHHAIDAGVMTAADIHAELGQILAGERPGRTSDEETFVFDSTGTALQDVAAAALVFDRAQSRGRGMPFELT
jgi:ornithine cyclodeaminase/alanine dehydrogenase-like protein (mu-crystallin family)